MLKSGVCPSGSKRTPTASRNREGNISETGYLVWKLPGITNIKSIYGVFMIILAHWLLKFLMDWVCLRLMLYLPWPRNWPDKRNKCFEFFLGRAGAFYGYERWRHSLLPGCEIDNPF
jgi:hypothetical protein